MNNYHVIARLFALPCMIGSIFVAPSDAAQNERAGARCNPRDKRVSPSGGGEFQLLCQKQWQCAAETTRCIGQLILDSLRISCCLGGASQQRYARTLLQLGWEQFGNR